MRFSFHPIPRICRIGLYAGKEQRPLEQAQDANQALFGKHPRVGFIVLFDEITESARFFREVLNWIGHGTTIVTVPSPKDTSSGPFPNVGVLVRLPV